MELKYALYRSDYFDSTISASRSKPAVFIADVLIAVSSFVIGVICFAGEYFLPSVALLFLSWFFAMKRVWGWKTIRHPTAMNSETDKDDITLLLDEEGVKYIHPAATLTAAWNDFSHYLEDDHRFLLMIQKERILLPVSKRAFTNEHQVNEARGYFERIKAKPQHPPLAKPH